MFPLRSRLSETLRRRKAVDDVWACSLLMSTLVCICGRSPMPPWSGSWFLSILVGKTRFSDPKISRFHFLSIFRCSSHRVQNAFLCPSWWCSGLVWVNPESFLNSHIMFCICPLEVANSITSSAYLKLVRQSWSWSLRCIPIPFLLCHRWISSFREYWRTVLNSKLDHLALILSGCRKCCSLRLSVQMPSGLCKSSSGGWCSRGRCCKIWGHPKLICERWNRTPSWSQLSLPTFWFSTHGIFLCSINKYVARWSVVW